MPFRGTSFARLTAWGLGEGGSGGEQLDDLGKVAMWERVVRRQNTLRDR